MLVVLAVEDVAAELVAWFPNAAKLNPDAGVVVVDELKIPPVVKFMNVA